MGDTVDRILYGTALRGPCELEYAHAVKLAAATGATLSTVHVHRPDEHGLWEHLPTAPWAPDLKEHRQSVEDDDAVMGLIRMVLAEHPDMLVLGTAQRQGLDRLRHGSVAEALTRRSGIVTLFTGGTTTPFVHPLDGSVTLRRVVMPVSRELPHQQRALDVLAYLAGALGVHDLEVVLLFCGAEKDFPMLGVSSERWTMRRRTSRDSVVNATLEAAQTVDADLVVMATHGEDTLVDSLLGSRTEHVVRQAPCPVLAVPVG
jgi:nucleotide-binding universal stress UspA family protein